MELVNYGLTGREYSYGPYCLVKLSNGDWAADEDGETFAVADTLEHLIECCDHHIMEEQE